MKRLTANLPSLLLMALVFVPESTGRETVSFDWWGAITLGIALSSLVLILDQGPTWGWSSWMTLSMSSPIRPGTQPETTAMDLGR